MSQPLLVGEQEYVQAEIVDGSKAVIERRIGEVKNRVDDLEQRVERLESLRAAIKREAVVGLLNLLAKSMKQVAAGEIDLEEVSAASPSKWEAVKKRQPPRIVEAIDILLVQGSMKRTQLAFAMKMDYSNCTKNVVGVLKSQGLLVEMGGELSLKEL